MGTSALAQTTVAWEFGYGEPANPRNIVVDLLPAQDDGVTAILLTSEVPTSTISIPTDSVVASFTENGDVRWFWTSSGGPVAGAVDSVGNIYVVVQALGGDAELVSLDADGQLRWRTDIEAPSTSFSYFVSDIDVSSTGECRVAGTAFGGNLFPRTIVHAIDPAGALLWRFDRSGGSNDNIPWGTPDRVLLSSTGETHVMGQEDFCCGGQTWIYQSLTADGALLDELVGPSSSFFDCSFGAKNANGDIAFISDGATFPFGQASQPQMDLRIYGASAPPAAVSLLPFVADPDAVNSARDLEYDGAGNLWVGIEAPDAVLRFDASGDFLSSWPAPGRIESLIPTADGGVFLLTESATAGEVQFVRMDSTGNVVRSVNRVGDFGLASSYGPPQIALDSRGNAFFATSTALPADPEGSRGTTTKWIDGTLVGTPYCGPAVANSTGAPASIRAYGSNSAQDNNLTLVSSALPPNTTVLLVASLDAGFAVGAGGSAGNLCLGGSIGRFLEPGQVRRSRPNGLSVLQVDLAEIPQGIGFQAAVAGETWRFQNWYRDLVGGAQSSNFTDATAVVLQ